MPHTSIDVFYPYIVDIHRAPEVCLGITATIFLQGKNPAAHGKVTRDICSLH